MATSSPRSKFQPPDPNELKKRSPEELIKEGILDPKLSDSETGKEQQRNVDDDICEQIAESQEIRNSL